jgi:hypothetical protein
MAISGGRWIAQHHPGLKVGEADHWKGAVCLVASSSIISMYNMSHILYYQHGSHFESISSLSGGVQSSEH